MRIKNNTKYKLIAYTYFNNKSEIDFPEYSDVKFTYTKIKWVDGQTIPPMFHLTNKLTNKRIGSFGYEPRGTY